MIDHLSAIVDYSTLILVKCLALWGERERNGRHYSRPADCTALGTAATSQSAFEQSNADRNRLDRECCQSHLVASLPLLARAGIEIRERCIGADNIKKRRTVADSITSVGESGDLDPCLGASVASRS